MTLYANTFEGLADETVITTGNSGGTSGSAFSSVIGSPVADTARAAHQTRSMRCPAGSTANYVYWNISGTNAAARAYIYLTATPTGETPIIRFYNASSFVLTAALLSTGKLRLSHVSSGLVGTSTANVPLNQWVRIEMRGTISGTAANVSLAMYAGDSATPIETPLSSTTSNTGTTDFAQARFGQLATTATPADMWFDSIAAETAAGGAFIGAAVSYSEAFPVTNNASTNWSAQNAATVLDCINDLSDTDWAETSTSTSVLDVTLGPLTAPAGDFTLRVRMDKEDATSGTMEAKLYDGVTLRHTVSGVSIPDPISTIDIVFPAANITAVTGWATGVRVTLTPTFS